MDGEKESEPEQCDNYTVMNCILGTLVGGACRTRGNTRNLYKSLVGTCKWKKKKLLRSKRKRLDDIKNELQMKQAQWNVLD